jgi:hypothetical protein
MAAAAPAASAPAAPPGDPPPGCPLSWWEEACRSYRELRDRLDTLDCDEEDRFTVKDNAWEYLDLHWLEMTDGHGQLLDWPNAKTSAFAAAGFTPLVLTAMERYPNSVNVQHAACVALAVLMDKGLGARAIESCPATVVASYLCICRTLP